MFLSSSSIDRRDTARFGNLGKENPGSDYLCFSGISTIKNFPGPEGLPLHHDLQVTAMKPCCARLSPSGTPMCFHAVPRIAFSIDIRIFPPLVVLSKLAVLCSYWGYTELECSSLTGILLIWFQLNRFLVIFPFGDDSTAISSFCDLFGRWFIHLLANSCLREALCASDAGWHAVRGYSEPLF